MKKILTVIGARPQFIKASVVSDALRNSTSVKEVVVHTGQHFDNNMSSVFFNELQMTLPNYNLNINSGPHGAMTGKMLAEIEVVLNVERPDFVLVYGDTNSTLAGSLAAAKLRIPILHIEAGLRSHNMHMPEEINRVLTDRLSSWLFTPTETANVNLLKEGFNSSQIIHVGDVMFDVAVKYGKLADLNNVFKQLDDISTNDYILVTIHRAESTDDPQRLDNIINALLKISEMYNVVFPMHPRTYNILKNNNKLPINNRRLKIIPPQGYLNMVALEKNSILIVTDSGGVQKEAYFHGKPCVTLRDETEWTELISAGWNTLVPPNNSEVIIESVISSVGKSGSLINDYGSGNSSQKIYNFISNI